MNNHEELKRDFGIVFVSGILTVLITNLTSVIIPLFTSYEVYAGYKIYSVYMTYSGLFHFGLINGVYLKYGKCMYSELPAEKMRGIFRLLCVLQIAFVVINITLIKLLGVTEIAYLFVAINIPFININCYYTLVNQFTKRFKLDAVVQLIQNVIMIGVMVLAYMGCFERYSYLLIAITVVNISTCISQLFVNRKITFGRCEAIEDNKDEISALFSDGRWVMFSELAGIALLNIDLIFVQHFFDITDFAFYSFASSVINAIYALIIYVNNIAYPYLVRSKDLKNISEKIYDLIIKLGILIMPTYYLISIFMKEFFAKYYPSVKIIRILYLTIVFKMLIVCFYGNICKVNKTNDIYLKINIIVLVIAIALNSIMIFLLGKYQGVAIATVVTMVIWWLILEIKLNEKISLKNIIRIVGASVCFAIIPEDNMIMGLCAYVFIILVLFAFTKHMDFNKEAKEYE
ncbi:MAG: oligosaccharide flippase family protein [Lachnospiraceae bacterium]|nr:oligosaccharide flippase family protein [Lachnospiraceae bacterium]